MDEKSHYHSYLLRFWQAMEGEEPAWRFLLEDPRTHEQLGFPDLTALLKFLETILKESHPAPGYFEKME